MLDHLREVSVLPISDNLSFIRRLPVQILPLPQKPESLWRSLLCPNETRYYLHRGEPRCLKACGRRHWASRVRDQDTQNGDGATLCAQYLSDYRSSLDASSLPSPLALAAAANPDKLLQFVYQGQYGT